jgi:hypothetical protein
MDKSTPLLFHQTLNIWPLEEKTRCYISGMLLTSKNQSEASIPKEKSIKFFSIKDYNGSQLPLNQELKSMISWMMMTNHMLILTSSEKKTRTEKENWKKRNLLLYLWPGTMMEANCLLDSLTIWSTAGLSNPIDSFDATVGKRWAENKEAFFCDCPFYKGGRDVSMLLHFT